MKNYAALDAFRSETLTLAEFVSVEFLEKIRTHKRKFNAKSVDVEGVLVEIDLKYFIYLILSI